jgi:flagellar biosynthesis protein FlhB
VGAAASRVASGVASALPTLEKDSEAAARSRAYGSGTIASLLGQVAYFIAVFVAIAGLIGAFVAVSETSGDPWVFFAVFLPSLFSAFLLACMGALLRTVGNDVRWRIAKNSKS